MSRINMFVVAILVALIPRQSLAQDIFDTLAQQFGVLNAITVSYDQSSIFFLAKKDGNWKLFEIKKSEGNTFSEAVAIDQANNLLQPGEDIEGTSVTADGTKLYFSVVNLENHTGEIYTLQRTAQGWSEAQKLSAEINTAGLEGSPSVSPDDRTLFFTRPNPDPEEDDYDARFIYISERDKNNNWAKAYKLPKIINRDCEFAPRIMPDFKTLYFSSVKEKKKAGDQIVLQPKGEFDIYKATRLAEKIWTEPEHVPSMSTINNDQFAAYDMMNKQMLFTSYMEKRETITGATGKIPFGNKVTVDPVYILKAKVVDASGQNLDTDLKIFDPYTSEQIASFGAKPNGEIVAVLPSQRNYRLDITLPGYSCLVKDINLKNKKLDSNLEEEIQFEVKNEIDLLLNVFDNTIYEPLNSFVVVKDAATDQILNLPVDSLGRGGYRIGLPIGKKYIVQVSKKAFETQQMEFDLTTDLFFSSFERDIELVANTKEMEINVADSETAEGMEVDIVVTNLDKNETLYLKARKGKDGKYKVKLREGDRYEIKVKNPKGYAYYTTKVDMSTAKEQSKLDVKLVALKAKTKLELKAITFEYNSAELRRSSYAELDRVVELLGENPELKVEISAHTDDKGSNAYNLKLSERRAASVVKYLSENGLPIEKLVSKGYGEASPLVPNDSDANRAKNRRVELEILEKNQTQE